MKDFLGNLLAIGDGVVLTAPNYRHLVKAEVTAFTAKKVRVVFYNTWNFPGKDGGYRTEFITDPVFLVKIKE